MASWHLAGGMLARPMSPSVLAVTDQAWAGPAARATAGTKVEWPGFQPVLMFYNNPIKISGIFGFISRAEFPAA